MTLPPPAGKIYCDEFVEWDIKINKMKSYTDLKQSKKLSEILPIESADMSYVYDRHLNKLYGDIPYVIGYKRLNKDVDIPCWSLAALLEQLDDNITNDEGNDLLLEIHKEDRLYYLNYHDRWEWQDDIETDYYDDFVDACVDMIIKLHEQKIL